MMFDFSLDGYQDFLKLISGKYQVLNFSQSRIRLSENQLMQGICCLRHDVDYSLESALKMAELENKLNISTSYFFLVDSDNYNIFSARSRKVISSIAEFGHEVGLHFDIANYEALDHNQVINFQKNALELVSQKAVLNISYHNPGAIGLENLSLDDKYEGLCNTYSKSFNNEFYYISDSLCQIREPDAFEKIKKRKFRNIHILIHPIWWCGVGLTRDKKIHNNFEEKKQFFLSDYQKTLIKYGIEQ